MMAVILIIGVIAAFALPAIMSAQRGARNAAVRLELTQLTAAINQFRNTYGVEPPSSVVIYTTQAGWQGDPTSMSKIRRMWPNFDFSMSIPGCVPSNWGAANVLTGAECLTFFLGGINTTGVMPQGFSKNPAAPFTPPGSDNRDGPYYDFKTSRFCDIDGDGFLEYRDGIPSQLLPIIYISSNEGGGYVFTDLIVSNNTGVPQPYNPFPGAGPNEVDMVFPYQSAGAASVAARQTIQPKSFQLISPGMDFTYGIGGTWAEGSTAFTAAIMSDVQPSGYFGPNSSPSLTAPENAKAHRMPEMDNITNFSTTTLGGR